MIDQYRAVVSGLGNIAWRFGARQDGTSLSHVAALERNHHTHLSAGCSPDENDRHAFEQEKNILSYANIEVMLDAVRPHLVSICSPTPLHFSQVRSCLKRQIPMIWLEKPPAETVSQLQELMDIQQRVAPDSCILVNFQRRYSNNYARMRQQLQKQNFGSERLVDIKYSRGLLTNGSHMLDILFFLFGDINYELLWVESGGDCKNPSFALRLEQGCLVSVCGCDLPYHNIDFTVTCDFGRIAILHNDMTPKIEIQVEHQDYPGFFYLEDMETNILGERSDVRSIDSALADLLSSHEMGRSPLSCLETALPGQKLLEQVLAQASL